MKKKHLLLACLCLCLGAVKAQTFEHYFTDRTLRVDYLFTGNAERQTICVDELSSLPRWAGRRHHLSELPLAGNGQITMKDATDGTVIYRTSFSALFQEWLETDEALTWFDGRTQWSYLLSSDEVNVSEPTSEELQSIHPYSWLSMYKQGYALKLESADATSYGITMTAMDKMSTLQRVTLYVDRATEQPLRLSLLIQGSSEPTEIVVRKYRSDCLYPDSFFVFDKKKYPTAEVIDLR